MNGFKRIILIASLCTIVSGTDEDESHTVSITKYDWIRDRQIFHGNRVVSMNQLLKESVHIKDIDEFVSEDPNLMYTTLKCMYADNIVDLLQTFYAIIERALSDSESDNSDLKFDSLGLPLMKTIIKDGFRGLKTLFEKTIYNLFFYLREYPTLRNSDQSLLKSILSVHRFLYYSRKKNLFSVGDFNTDGSSDNDPQLGVNETIKVVRLFNNTIVQVVGLMERFRFKHCNVEFPYRNYRQVGRDLNLNSIIDPLAVQDLIKSKIEPLDSLIHLGPVSFSDSNYDENMYDSENILMGHLLKFDKSILAKAIVVIKGIYYTRYVRLELIYEIIKNTYNIVSVLKYQNVLIDIIGHIFARQMFRLLPIPIAVSEDLWKLKSSLNSFVSAVIPNNCLSTLCDFINKMNLYLNHRLLNYERGFPIDDEDVKKMNIELLSKYSGKYWIDRDDIGAVEKVNLENLVDSILNNKSFVTFRQVISLLSYESNTNSAHDVINELEVPRNSTMNETKNNFGVFSELRFGLFSFQIIFLDNFFGIESDESASSCKTYMSSNFKVFFSSLTSYAIDSYNSYENNISARNIIILPLLVYLHNVHESFDDLTMYDYIKLKHILLLTITVLENYCFRKFKWLTPNLNMYTVHTLNPKETMNFMKQNMDVTVEAEHSNYLKTVHNNVFFHDLRRPYDNFDLWFYWNGTPVLVDDILNDLPISINDVQDLIRYRFLLIKWFVAKILIIMKYILKHIGNVLAMYRQGEIFRFSFRWYLASLIARNYPMYVVEFLKPSVEMFLANIGKKNQMLDDFYTEFSLSVIESSLVSLGVAVPRDFQFTTEVFAFKYLKKVIEWFENILSQIYNEYGFFSSSIFLLFSTSFYPV